MGRQRLSNLGFLHFLCADGWALVQKRCFPDPLTLNPERFQPLCFVFQREKFHGRWQYLFIESICNDTMVLEQNYRYKMMYSPDYVHSHTEEVSTQSRTVYGGIQGGLRGGLGGSGI